ncbi:dethiobiotin synthase [Xanthomonas arboricola pv. corylina]|uniref:dethiobiotin synthase n=1 Tax=Xanthomonas arboricola TaxID=56448 RepID=UPI000CEE8590|nr:dethiobiotin synthase [Xanthomonas arboricola]MDN0202590.1 dethiobiotin synthase [Xanthomonas arboricola pv. corylina]MDN0214506.1 dethiobiotin synthase [Xanthomonas arboricola pv. corylina]PPU63198.1 dethiobiotin synthase [Xanthomonas arboricola pv. corylina]CAE6837025.1 ATP-dependent dethiobiotin synthetase BioD 1 [Xanthomonas arboricola pv. corylina]CAE6837034.1 ATP-dependent dethiobiotin synthetase BioD 1 [Xanthomonas arboricola pv. corylina]
MQLLALYVTGTDTGIGKTMASTALLHALRRQGHTAVGMKPVASGCEHTPQGWRNEDALALQAASAPQPDYATLNPYALPAPLAPELAAADVGVTLSLEPIAQAFAQLRAQAEVVVVEGVGGWAAPLSADLDQADLVRALKLPVVLVVGIRLGCINHARLSAAAIAADGLDCIGWIANEVDPQMERIEENIGMLRQRLAMPCWGRIGWRPGADAAAQSLGLHVPV